VLRLEGLVIRQTIVTSTAAAAARVHYERNGSGDGSLICFKDKTRKRRIMGSVLLITYQGK
jgi:hypothetical protein